MLKLSRYIVISALFLLALVIFLAFNPDSYNVEPADSGADVIRRAVVAAESSEWEIAVVTDGASNGAVIKNISLTLSLLKREYMICESVMDAAPAKTIIMAAKSVHGEDVDLLKDFLAGGGSVIFAGLPEMTEEVMGLLGVNAYAPHYLVEGFDLYDGVLLGGMFRAEELRFYCAKVTLSGRCKVFANGHKPGRDKADQVIDQDDENPLIWRTYHEGGAVFALNAPFMADSTGMGVLTGLLALTQEDFLYPIVGTKSVILDHLPYIGGGTAAGRSYLAFTRDIVWPGLISIARSTGVTYTCYADNGFQEDANADDSLDFMNKELRKINGELGYSAYDSGIYESDMAFWRERFPSLVLRSVKAGDADVPALDSATSVLLPNWDGAFEWRSEQSISLPLISHGIDSEQNSFQIASMVSALGLVIHGVDMEPMFDTEATWNEYSVEISKYFAKTLKGLRFLRAAPINRAAEAAKDYLNAEMDIRRDEWSITASISGNVEEASFLLRTEKDVSKSENCTVSKIEDGAYLVSSPGPEFTVHFARPTEGKS